MRILKAVFLCLAFLMIFSSCALNNDVTISSDSSDEMTISSDSSNEMTLSSDSSDESDLDKSIADFLAYNFGFAMNLLRRTEDGNCVPIDRTILEYTGTPMEFILSTKVFADKDYLDPNEAVKMRIMLFQDGALLPHSLTNNGEYTLFSDVEVMPDGYKETLFPIYFTPYCYYEYSAVTVMCECRPDYVPIPEIKPHETGGYSKVIKTPANEQVPSTVSISYAADYVDIPEYLVGSNGGVTGVGIGAEMIKSRTYHVEDRLGMHERLSLDADEVYLKVNYASDWTMYAFVLCDGYPIKAFDGNYALVFDCEKGTKTLNQKIDLPPDISNGVHILQGIVIQKNNSTEVHTFSDVSTNTAILINNPL